MLYARTFHLLYWLASLAIAIYLNNMWVLVGAIFCAIILTIFAFHLALWWYRDQTFRQTDDIRVRLEQDMSLSVQRLTRCCFFWSWQPLDPKDDTKWSLKLDSISDLQEQFLLTYVASQIWRNRRNRELIDQIRQKVAEMDQDQLRKLQHYVLRF